MREATGSTWTFQMIILFILIFSAFLALVLNYNKVYSVKNEMISILEKHEASSNSLTLINNYLREKGYKNKGKCPTDELNGAWFGVDSYDSGAEIADKNKDYYYCLQEVVTGTSNDHNRPVYYNIIFFYKFNLPVIGDILNFQVKGRTKTFVGANDRIGG